MNPRPATHGDLKVGKDLLGDDLWLHDGEGGPKIWEDDVAADDVQSRAHIKPSWPGCVITRRKEVYLAPVS
jgi:hypothetical protein